MDTGIPLLALALAACFLSGVHSATFTIQNHCSFTIWPALLTGAGPQLPSTGFQLPSYAARSLDVSAPWSGRVWARYLCSSSAGKFSCQSGDCASGQVACGGAGGIPPVTLAEFTLATGGGKDYYDVSIVDGFNLPVSVAPSGGNGRCSATGCPADINRRCPPELAVENADGGGAIGCKSACLAFNQPQYCCTGAYNSPGTCKPTNYSLAFKQQCPESYSYAYDDKTSLFACSGGPDYLITFCP
ncbi:hypothetical protein NMG60_11000649 [Bertholletia excelsa]